MPHQVHQVHIQPKTPPVKIEEMIGKEGGLWQALDVANQHLFNSLLHSPVAHPHLLLALPQQPAHVCGEVAPFVGKPDQ